MKKKVLCIGLAIGLLVVGSLLVCLLINSARPVRITMDVKPAGQINYNNYIVDNRLDYKNNQFAWQNNSLFGSKLTLLSDSDTPSVLSGITAPFQLLKDRVVFIKNGNLLVRMLSGKQDKCISEKTTSFIAREDAVLYLSEGMLLQYNWFDQNTSVLGENVYQFFIHQDQLYVVNLDEQLLRLEQNGTWCKLYAFQMTSYPFCVMPQGNSVVYLKNNELQYVDILTGISETVCLTDGNYANNRINFICDDNSLFVSFQATETDGSIVKDVDHANNGVWSVDHQTKEKEKVCNETFSQLYLFEGNQLFGVKDDKLYQIDTESGNVTQISD